MTQEIAANDFLYQFMIRARGRELGHERYLVTGESDARQIAAEFKRYLGRERGKVLEFASGYGRVSRHLKAALPLCDIVASDIHPEACAFVREKFGVTTMVSTTNPAHLNVGRDYDFIFVLSLFSHLPDKTFGDWIKALYAILSPGGVLYFTTHGENSRKRFVGIDLTREEQGDGWIYRRASDQDDLDLEDYGTMLVTPRYVLDAIVASGAMLVGFESGTWLGHQDLWVIRKDV